MPQPGFYKQQDKATTTLPLAHGFSDGELLTLQLKARFALDSFRAGNATLKDFAAINTVLATGLLLAAGETPEVAGPIELARIVLLQVQRVPEVSLTDEQFMRLANGLSYGEGMLESSTPRQIRNAALEAMRLSKAKKIGVGRGLSAAVFRVLNDHRV